MTGALLFLAAAVLLLVVVLLARAGEAAAWRGTLVAFRLSFPRGLRPEQVVAFLSSLPPDRRGRFFGPPPLGLEIEASAAGIEHRLLVPEPDVETVTAQLQAALPGLRLERLGTLPEPSVDVARELRLTSRVNRLGVERVEASAAALLASLQPLRHGESLTLQWLLRGGVVPLVPRRRPSRTAKSPWSAPDGVEPVERAALSRKQADQGLQVVGRLGVTAGDVGRRLHLVGRVLAGLSVLDAVGVELRAARLPNDLVRERLLSRAWPLLAWPLSLNTREAAGLLGLPVGELDLPGLELGGARQLPAPAGALREGVLLGVSDHPGTFERELRLTESDRLRHLHLIGPTGTGKSTLMARLVLEDLKAGRGLVVVDPKRDLVEAVLARLPAHRLDDVVVLDPVDTARPVGLNVLARAGDGEAEQELVSEHLLGVFQSLWKDSWGPRSDDILRAGLLTLCSARAVDGAVFTLPELPALLTDKAFRRFVLHQPSIPPHVRGFWEWFEKSSPWERNQALAPVLNKVRAFTMRTPLRLLLGQSAGFDLRRMLSERQVVLVPLSAGELGKPAAELLGSLIVAAVWQVIRGRTAVPADDRKPVFVYLDEFQDVLRLPLDLADLLAQSRGLGAGLTLAHQHLGQLDRDVRAAVLATARSQAVFQVAADDARVLARGFAPSLTADDLSGLDGFHFALKAVHEGRVIRPVTGRSLPLLEGHDSRDIKARSRQAWGTPRASVEAGLERRLGGASDGADGVPIGRKRKAAKS